MRHGLGVIYSKVLLIRKQGFIKSSRCFVFVRKAYTKLSSDEPLGKFVRAKMLIFCSSGRDLLSVEMQRCDGGEGRS